MELEKSIKILRNWKAESISAPCIYDTISVKEFNKSKETVLQALEELQQKEKSRIIGNINEIKIEDLEPILKPYYIPKEKVEKKEKVINEMAKLISDTYCDDPDSICLDLDEEYPTVENIKQYFERKVEE